MDTMLLNLRLKLLELVKDADAQDMVEYALIFALLALGATTATNFLANGLAGAFQGISTTLHNYTN